MLYSHTQMPCLTLLKQVWLHPPLDVEESHLLSSGTEHRDKNRPNQVKGEEKPSQTPKLPQPLQFHVDSKEQKAWQSPRLDQNPMKIAARRSEALKPPISCNPGWVDRARGKKQALVRE